MQNAIGGNKNPAACVLAGDIGGTKTNLGLFKPGENRPLALAAETFSSREAAGLEEIIEQMLDRHPEKVKAACFGIAGPVVDGECRTTNLPWVVSEKKLGKRFGWDRVRLLNDLSATVLAVPLLDDREVTALNTAQVRKDRNIGLVAPGTGLGQALLIYHEGRYRPVASEGGHVDFAPTEETEVDLWRFLHERFGHVSGERLLTGQGLVNIYEWLKSTGVRPESSQVQEAMGSADPARIITENAIENRDPLCRLALERFCRILGAVAGNLALTGMTTGGMFLGGGIPPKIFPLLETSDFMSAFIDKGRFSEVLKHIAVRVICNDRAALLGAAHHAFEL